MILIKKNIKYSLEYLLKSIQTRRLQTRRLDYMLTNRSILEELQIVAKH